MGIFSFDLKIYQRTVLFNSLYYFLIRKCGTRYIITLFIAIAALTYCFVISAISNVAVFFRF